MLKGYTFRKTDLLRVLTLVWLVIHFSLTLMYVAPPNPVRDTMQPLLNATIGKYFPQDWNLFAPQPRTADLALLVRPMTSAEAQRARVQGLPVNGWYDLSAPLWTQFQLDRFSAYNKLGRPADQAIAHYLEGVQDQSVQVMVRLASAFCKDTQQNQATLVALAISEKSGMTWDQRTSSQARPVKITILGIYPIDKQVENIHIYQEESKRESLP